MIDRDAILHALRKVWSKASSSKWTEEKPALGQCSPTSLVIQDLFGGNLLKTRVGNAWHFYNQIDGTPLDFTAEQFDGEPTYLAIPATRDEALSDCTIEQYQALLEAFTAIWEHKRDA